ncbi:hypothetical protein KAR91_06310, partial [Candidatus Pacearchaeota archaeon]|nr:hypothetical protein [Candidatus Pacearchaeota archaeon]
STHFGLLSDPGCLTALRISGGRMRELAREDDRPLHPLDGRRFAPDRMRMGIRSDDGVARSVRAIGISLSCEQGGADLALQGP